jgi:predicted DsbA family dithiol-disulfide isomerase
MPTRCGRKSHRNCSGISKSTGSRARRSTLDALALVNRAYRTDPEIGERMSFALRDALFEQGRDISKPETLELLAHDLGVFTPDESDRAAVVADWHEGQQRGVLGSPHFFCGDTDVFCPTLDIAKDPIEGLSVARDVLGLRQFLAQCLARPEPT